MSLNGNGHTNGNGNGHKPHHTKNLYKVTKKSLAKAAVESDGSPTKMAKMLGIHVSTAHDHLKKPTLQKLILETREEAIKKSKLKLTKAYKRVDEALDAKVAGMVDHDIRLKAAKITHEIYHPKEGMIGAEGQGFVLMPVMNLNGDPVIFKVGKNARPIDV